MIKYFSPLRYPGGKAKIANYIKLILSQNYLLDGHYVEPFAGGASVALELIINEYVSKVFINDIDKHIYSFWHSVLFQTEQLCKMIYDNDVSMSEWHHQKKIQQNFNNYSILELGYSTFFLNRTNRSGILNAGVIGGKNQTGIWKLDARFNKSDLIQRIQMIANFKDRIELSNLDAIDFICKTQKKSSKKTLIYLDPPYYNKGKQLYLNFYNHKDHIEIANLITSINKGNWIISYDNHPEIQDIYHKFRQRTYSLNYSAAKPSVGSEIMIYDNQLKIPDIINPTDKREIKEYSKIHCV